MHLQLRDQQLKTISCIYIDSYQNFSITAYQKYTIDTHTGKKNQLKYNTKNCHQTRRGENQKEGKKKEQQKQIPSN